MTNPKTPQEEQCCDKCFTTYTEHDFPAHTILDACTDPQCDCHTTPQEKESWKERFYDWAKAVNPAMCQCDSFDCNITDCNCSCHPLISFIETELANARQEKEPRTGDISAWITSVKASVYYPYFAQQEREKILKEVEMELRRNFNPRLGHARDEAVELIQNMGHRKT